MKPSARVLLAAILLSAVVPVGAMTAASAFAQTTLATERTVIFAVENMDCGLCAVTVRTAMERVPGVTSVAIDFDAESATVVYDPAHVTVDAIAAASTNAGYPARVLGN